MQFIITHYKSGKQTAFIIFLWSCLFVHIGCRPASTEATSQLDSLSLAPESSVDSTLVAWSEEDEMLGLGKVHFGDLDSMIARRQIRALVPYTKTYYFIDGKERKGLAYDALNLFEEELNASLKFHPPQVRVIFIPVSREQLIPLLNAGYGDMIFGGFTITEERKERVDFSAPTISGLTEIVVGGPASKKLGSVADLAGQHVFVHDKSSYQSSLQKLSDSLRYAGLDPIQIELIDPYLEKEDILEMVQAGLIPFTVVENDMADYWSNVLDSLVLYPAIVVNRNVSYGVAFRKESPQLKAKVDQFVAHTRKGTRTGNILYNKYLNSTTRLKHAHAPAALKQLKNTEQLFKKYSTHYNLDWLLVAAQGYQESGLNQQVKSSAGAVGIMQVKPSTAAGNPINIQRIDILENNIHAGTKYMRHLMDEYFSEEGIDSLNRQLFALAAYNSGPGRVRQFRKKCLAQGLDPNIWFNNVEKIAAHEIGRETVQYVSNIYKYYTSYRALNEYAVRSGKKLI